MIPGWVRNCSRTSNTTRPAARPTALMASPEKRKTTAAPITTPTRTLGLSTDRVNDPALRPAATRASSTAVRNEPNSAVAASTAVAMAMPLVMALVVLPTVGVKVGQHLGTRTGDVAGHLGDALGVVTDRAVGVHGDDDADGGEQAGAGQGDGEQRHHHRAGAEQEGAVDGGRDQQRRVDGRLQTDGDAGQDDRGSSGQRRPADVLQ